MGTIIYIVLIAVCVVFVYNIFESQKQKCGYRFTKSRPLEMLSIVLLGLILAGMVAFFFRFIFIPLALVIIIYLIATKYKR